MVQSAISIQVVIMPLSILLTVVAYCQRDSFCQSLGNPIADASTFGYFANKDLKRAANVF